MKERSGFGTYVRIALTLCIITALVGALLAGVNLLTADRIEENNRKAVNEAVASIFGECSTDEISFSDDTGLVKSVYAVEKAADFAGFCVYVSSNGYGGAAEFMVGIGTDGKVSGISVVSHSETPNIGTKVFDDPEYLSGYEGLSGTLSFGNGVDAIAGATRSSTALLNGVNAALALGLSQDDYPSAS